LRAIPEFLEFSLPVDSEFKVNRYRIEAVDRALMLLNTLASNPGVSASELATALKANRSLVFRMLSTLADRGFVSKDSNNFYSLGPQLLYLGLQAEGGNSLNVASKDVLDDLAKDTQETVGVIVRNELDTIAVAFRDSSQLLRFHSGFAAKGGLHQGAASKLLLAFSPDDIIEQVIGKYLGEFAPATLRTREKVLALLETIRREGYYAAIGDVNPDVFSISAPVRDTHGVVIAALAVLGPTSRLDADKRNWLIQRVVESAALISSRIR
jgi:IclR family KDG regulon transcriptional repressor